MGFFSAIKKFLGSETKEEQKQEGTIEEGALKESESLQLDDAESKSVELADENIQGETSGGTTSTAHQDDVQIAEIIEKREDGASNSVVEAEELGIVFVPEVAPVVTQETASEESFEAKDENIIQAIPESNEQVSEQIEENSLLPEPALLVEEELSSVANITDDISVEEAPIKEHFEEDASVLPVVEAVVEETTATTALESAPLLDVDEVLVESTTIEIEEIVAPEVINSGFDSVQPSVEQEVIEDAEIKKLMPEDILSEAFAPGIFIEGPAPEIAEAELSEPQTSPVETVTPEDVAPEVIEPEIASEEAVSVAVASASAAVVADSVQSATPVVSSYSGLSAEEQASLSLALRSVEPRLSAWLAVVTEGITSVSPLLWQRLRYLLESLEAKEHEAEAFVQDFQAWLTRMEYEYVEEFRSELQYRLALALELEDEEDERNRLFVKLSDGLARTREQFTRKLDVLFASHGAFDAAFWEEMEELFIMADVGFESSMELIERLKDGVRKQGLTDPKELRGVLQEELTKIFQMQKRIVSFNAPEVVMMIGVNGVGKTTTIAKLAHRDRMQGKKVLIAAADTFRAAATEQLGVWAERVGADFHRKDAGADPAAVAFEAMDLAIRGNYDVLYVDTAGRLQTKVNLMEELTKIRNVVTKKHAGAPHRSILVVDATTGQNALSQTKLFKEAAGIDEIILSKLDGTAKGGVAISVAMQFQIPITYVGLGEKLEDLRPFNGKDFALALLGEEITSE